MDGPQPVQHTDTQPRQQEAAGTTEDGNHQILDEQLPHQAKSRGAERAPDRELTLTCLGARQEQVGDVHARNEEHEPDRRAQRHQRRLHIARDDLTERPHRQPQPTWVRGRMTCVET